MIFRQLFDTRTSTFTYLLADESTREAVLIDCVFEQHLRDLALLRELDLKLVFTLDTHLHADHVTGAWLMQRATGSRIAMAAAAGAQGVDEPLSPGDELRFGAHRLEVRATPGHTNGCLSYVLHEQERVFTGDALLIRGAGRTDFQHGDAHQLYQSVREQILSLPRHYQIFPAHDYEGRCSSTVDEERRHNPRLGDRVREQDFVGYMTHLGLPHPKQLAIALPANLRCGRPQDDASASSPDWAPAVRTYAGVWQVEPEWVHAHKGELHILDVRETGEAKVDMMGRVDGSRTLPLSRLRAALDEVPRDRPIACICPSGARSAVAANVLQGAGFERVANVKGGLLEWRAQGLPLEVES